MGMDSPAVHLTLLLNPSRPTAGKVLPPRPPLAKAGPGRPPPPRVNGAAQSPSIHEAVWESSPPKLRTQVPAQMPKRKGPVLPPRPNPGHRLYNKYTVRELPLPPHKPADRLWECIAVMWCNIIMSNVM